MGDTRVCDCQCHTGPYAACSIPGGCGSVGCGRNGKTSTAGACTLCAVYRPDSDARLPHRPPVCDGDRTLLDRHLNDIANLVADLSTPEPPILVDTRYERFDRNGDSLGEVWKDPLTAVGGVAPINSRSKAPTVSGSRERPIPIPVTALDLKAPAKVPALAPSPRGRDEPANGWPEDQVGYLSAATVLDQWVRDVRDTLHPDHHLPTATVDELVLWLRNRVDDICNRHPAVVDLAEEIRSLRSALRSAAGETDPPPEPCDGVSCARCEKRALYRRPGDTYRAECSSCGILYTEDEYTALLAELAKAERGKRDPQEVAALLRHS